MRITCKQRWCPMVLRRDDDLFNLTVAKATILRYTKTIGPDTKEISGVFIPLERCYCVIQGTYHASGW